MLCLSVLSREVKNFQSACSEWSHQQQPEERCRECAHWDDAALCLQRLSSTHRSSATSPARLVQRKKQLLLPHWKARAHCCVDHLLVRHMIESFQQVIEDGVATACTSARWRFTQCRWAARLPPAFAMMTIRLHRSGQWHFSSVSMMRSIRTSIELSSGLGGTA